MVDSIKTVCMLIYNYYPQPTGGAERQCRLQAKELVRSGCRCFVVTAKVCNDIQAREMDQGCEIIRVPVVQPVIDRLISIKNTFSKEKNCSQESTNQVKTGIDVKAGAQVGILAIVVQWMNTLCFIVTSGWFIYRNRSEIDVIHTHVASWNAGFAGWIGNLLNIPVVCKAAYLPPFDQLLTTVPFSSFWSKWRKKTNYIALVPEMAQALYDEGVDEANVTILPNGVLIPSERAPVENNRTVLYVGNFSQGSGHKGFDTLLKSWAIVSKNVADAHLVLAGGGDLGKWKSLAENLQCINTVSFLGHVADLGRVYMDAGIFILPSRGEGMSNALLEAHSYGIPAVVSDIPGNREIVQDGETGYIVPVDAHDEYASAVIALLRDPSLRYNFGINARERTINKYSIERVVEEVRKTYLTLC